MPKRIGVLLGWPKGTVPPELSTNDILLDFKRDFKPLIGVRERHCTNPEYIRVNIQKVRIMASLKPKRSSAPRVPSVFPFKTAFYFKQAGKRIYVCTMETEQRAAYEAGNRPSLTDDQNKIFMKMLALEEASSPSNPDRSSMKVETLAELYLRDRKGLICDPRFDFYTTTLQSFCDFAGAKALTDLTPSLVRQWRAEHGQTWKSTSYVRGKYKVVLQMVNFAVTERILPHSPLTALGKALATEAPDAKREACVYDPERQAILAACSAAFRSVVLSLLETGRRPDEIANAKKSEVVRTAKGIQWRIKDHKNFKKTNKPETIYLTPEMQQLTLAALADESNKTPYLFVTDRGKQWTTGQIGKYWIKAKTKAKIKTASTPYSCRHSYITKALHNGVPLAVVAMLVGNSVEVLARHYSHIEAQHIEVYFQAATQAVRANDNYRTEEVAAKPHTSAGKAAV